MDKLKFGTSVALVFVAGVVAGINLSKLVPNELYLVGWGKVAIAVLVALWFGGMAWRDARKR